jgi:hypothetical protein
MSLGALFGKRCQLETMETAGGWRLAADGWRLAAGNWKRVEMVSEDRKIKAHLPSTP